ncbi:MAG: enoyl-CoA hydratase/isomerase family protein [Betaproteobacteria bacterium]|nr:enoyl-CoA hydratase/isomerase family protein [Betaproteobacteria bacterium]
MTGLPASGQRERTAEGLVLERDTQCPGLMTLTIDRQDDLNRLTPEVMIRLGRIATALADDTSTDVLLITGSGTENFSMGILNPAIRASYSKEEIVEIVMRSNRVFDAIEALPQIVIVAINGKVLAGAVELCLACDLRYASQGATMTMPEATWGGFPGAGAPVRLPMIVGRARAIELICTGRTITADEMSSLGLVQGLYAPDALMSGVLTIARKIASSGPLAVRGAKRISAERQEPGFHAARILSDQLRRELEWSQDVDEGMAAHKENRKPRFVGR